MEMRTSILVGILLALLSLPAWAGGQSKSSQAALSKEAKVTMEQAQKTALAKEAGKIKSKELEREKGRLIYSFDIKTADGIHEVNIDAMTGEVVEDTVESTAAEAKEKAADKKQKKSEQAAAPNN
jgi:Peptidase propeptide and YPEB domain